MLGIATDFFYQWKNLVPQYEKRLTTIERIYVENIEVGSVNVPVAIYGDKEKPVNTVILKNIKAKHTLNKTNIIEREINFQEN